MTSLSSIHAYHLTVFHSYLSSKKGVDKITQAIDLFKQQNGAEKAQTEVKRLIHEIDPQLIHDPKKMTRISRIYYAIISLFTETTSIRTLVRAFNTLNEEIQIENLITFDLEDPRIPLAPPPLPSPAPAAPLTIDPSTSDPDLTLPPMPPLTEIDEHDEEERSPPTLDPAWTAAIARFRTNMLLSS